MVKLRKVAIYASIFVVVGLTGFGSWMLVPEAGSQKVLVSSTDQKILNRPYFYPKDKRVVAIDQNTVRVDTEKKVISFFAHLTDGNVLLGYSQQKGGSDYIDSSDKLKTLLKDLGKYASFTSPYGTVYLTKSVSQKNQPVAVLNSNGNLLFIQAEKDLTDVQWKAIIDDLSLAGR
jgi:hypothetical protein